MKTTLVCSCLLAVLHIVALSAHAAILTFDGDICEGAGPCADGSAISQTYGDTAEVNVTYDGQAGGSVSNMFFWSADYSGLENVAYGASGVTAEIFLDPTPGFSVTLNSFDLGGWPNADIGSQWTILDGLGNLLIQSGPIIISGQTPTTVQLNLFSDNGFRVQFGPDAFNAGIDNLSFDTAAAVVPLPAAVWLMLSSLLVFVRRRGT